MHWRLTYHACRSCGGRIMRAIDGELFRCVDCELSAPELAEVCACGTPSIGSAELRCIRNTDRRPLGAPAVIFELFHTTRA